MTRVCVFCGSSPGRRTIYGDAATALAQHLVKRNIGVVYGGGRTGLMGILADAALAAGGDVIGVMPRSMVGREKAHTGLSDLRVVDSMHARKALMAELSDGFIAMPGGYGTFEEFCEALTWTQLGFHQKPCGILNVARYYDPLLKMLDNGVDEGFVKAPHRAMVVTDDNVETLVEQLVAWRAPVADKWIVPGHA